MAIHMQRRATSLRLQLGGAPATRHCSLRTGKESLRSQGCSPGSLSLKPSQAVREVPLSSVGESTSTSSSMSKKARSDLKWKEKPHSPSTFKIVATTLAGASATVEASSIHSVARVKELVAAALGVGCYRLNLTTLEGIELNENTSTLADFGIVSDVEVVASLGEANRWRDMPRSEFIDLLVESGAVESQKKARFLFQSVRHEKKEYEVRKRYITCLERLESDKERILKREEAKMHIADEVAAIVSGAVNKIAAVESLSEHMSTVIDIGIRRSVKELQLLQADAKLAVSLEEKKLLDAEQTWQTIFVFDLVRDIGVNVDAGAIMERMLKRDLRELRALTAPPPAVILTMMAVCILFHREPSMSSIEKLFADANLHQKMRNYDKESLSDDVIQKLEPFLSLEPDHVERVSPAAAECSRWAHAMVAYHRHATTMGRLRKIARKTLQDEEDVQWQHELWMNHLSELQVQTQQAS
eukprot:TRINITY_DN15613_c0_g6_i1.p1 TRINITY_DN15613_c0_g6~~TRINITY_DN15613_c0_g6_i1.p1  ORF type:complete len:471 (-),score=58.76 TRINITY_DN15613_c0_g6_i1:245-1657(-)